MSELDHHREPESASGETPVRDAYRYIANRPGQFDYPAAIAANLPIGSGAARTTTFNYTSARPRIRAGRSFML